MKVEILKVKKENEWMTFAIGEYTFKRKLIVPDGGRLVRSDLTGIYHFDCDDDDINREFRLKLEKLSEDWAVFVSLKDAVEGASKLLQAIEY